MYTKKNLQIKLKKQKRIRNTTYEADLAAGMYNPFIKYPTPEKLQKRLNEFLDYVKKNEVPMTIGRLAYFLGVSNDTINRYAEKWQYYEMIRDIKQFILADKEERLCSSSGNKGGIIFDLINNHHYRNYAPIPAPQTQDSPESIANEIQQFVKKAQMVCIPPEGATLDDFESGVEQ